MTAIIEELKPNPILLFGSGLLGSTFLTPNHRRPIIKASIQWYDSVQRKADFSKAFQLAGESYDLVWAAGKIVPSSRKHDFETHQGVFQDFMAALLAAPPPRKAVYLGSAGGVHTGQGTITEFTVPNPVNRYGHVKLEEELLLSNLLSDLPTELLLLRVSSAFGAYQDTFKSQGLVTAVLRAAARNQEVVVRVSLNSSRDFIFAPDVGRSVLTWIEAPSQGGQHLKLFHSGRSITLLELFRLVERITYKRVRFRLEPSVTLPFEGARLNSRVTIPHLGSSRTPLETGIRILWDRISPIGPLKQPS